MFAGRNLTFEDIEKLNVKQFSQLSPSNKDPFRPSDILNLNETYDEEDEILKKFKFQSPKDKNSNQRLSGPSLKSKKSESKRSPGSPGRSYLKP